MLFIRDRLQASTRRDVAEALLAFSGFLTQLGPRYCDAYIYAIATSNELQRILRTLQESDLLDTKMDDLTGAVNTIKNVSNSLELRGLMAPVETNVITNGQT